MKRIAKFYKVSLEQFESDINNMFGEPFPGDVNQVYESIELPTRATKGSAGYDFKAPFGFSLAPGETIKIPTGVRVNISDSWVLECFPRSSLGFKYRCQLDNSVGIIDADYYHSKNEGHIILKLTNDSKSGSIMSIEAGAGIAQGIFHEFGITVDDNVTEERDGGFGSTDKKGV